MGRRSHNRGSGRHPAPLPPSRLVVLGEGAADNLDFVRAVLGGQMGRELSRQEALDALLMSTADEWAGHVAFALPREAP